MDITIGTSPERNLRLVPRDGAGVTITEVELDIDLDAELPCTCSDHDLDGSETIPAYLLSGAHVGSTVIIPEHDGVMVTLIADRIEHVDGAVYITDLEDDPDRPLVLRRSVDVIVPTTEHLDLEAVDDLFLDAA